MRSPEVISANLKRLGWIRALQASLTPLLGSGQDVFVGAECTWHPTKEEPANALPLDLFVIFGRPNTPRVSYRQWEESDVPPTVVIDVPAPAMTASDAMHRFAFCDEHGVEEYLIYDPHRDYFSASVRNQGSLTRARFKTRYTSRYLGIHFDRTTGHELQVLAPDFAPLFGEGHAQRLLEEERRQRVAAELRAHACQSRLARLAELTQKIRRGEATPEEIAELDRLAAESQQA